MVRGWSLQVLRVKPREVLRKSFKLCCADANNFLQCLAHLLAAPRGRGN
jgi:hypothetical protein